MRARDLVREYEITEGILDRCAERGGTMPTYTFRLPDEERAAFVEFCRSRRVKPSEVLRECVRAILEGERP